MLESSSGSTSKQGPRTQYKHWSKTYVTEAPSSLNSAHSGPTTNTSESKKKRKKASPYKNVKSVMDRVRKVSCKALKLSLLVPRLQEVREERKMPTLPSGTNNVNL